jgi:hypothetical protein
LCWRIGVNQLASRIDYAHSLALGQSQEVDVSGANRSVAIMLYRLRGERKSRSCLSIGT